MISLHFPIGLFLLKLPVGLDYYFFQDGRYSRALFAADKLDQGTNLALCGYVFYAYLAK